MMMMTGRHPPLTISLTLAPTLPSVKISFLGHLFISTYSFSLSVSFNPFFHDCLPTYCILSQMYFFHTFLSIFIPRLTIPFTLTSLNNIRLTNAISPNLVHICLHLAHHLDLHPVSIKHALTSNYLQTPFVTSIPPLLLFLSPQKYSNLSLL